LNSAQFFSYLTGNRWLWRSTLALLFLLPILVVLPHARSLVVRNAVVTAYLGHINAPINGRIESINSPAGSAAQQGVPAMIIQNDRISRGHLARLEARHQSAELEVEQMHASLDRVRTLTNIRHTDQEEFVAAIGAELTLQLQQAEKALPAREAELAEATAGLQRAQTLQASCQLSPAELESAQADHEGALAALSANQLQRERLAQQLKEIHKGVFQIGVPDGVLLTRQLVQQLDLEMIQLERQLRASETELLALRAEHDAAALGFERASRAEIDLEPGATVWSVYASTGAWTSAGAAIMSVVNCDRLMVDIAVDDATLELIAPGQKVRVRLFGTYEYIAGEVVLVRGSAGLGDTPVLAAEVPDRGYRKGRVLARLDASTRANQAAQSCAIGRTAYAEFEDISVLETILYPLFR
jgi:multidrug efflux pump subunit AcrA (membrane-fusion protein)